MESHKQLCIVCHKEISFQLEDLEQDPIITNNFIGCFNKHLAHIDCIREWMLNNITCPFCSELYDLRIVNHFADYKAKIELMKKEKEENELKEKARQKELAEKWDPDLEKGYCDVFELEEKGDFSAAIKRLWDLYDKYAPNPKAKGHKELLLELGRCYLQSHQYALATNQLMKLIKIDFKFPLAFYYLGLSYEMINLSDKAKWAYDRAIPNIEELISQSPDYQAILDDVKDRLAKLQILQK